MEFVKKIKAFILKNNLIKKGEKVVIGFSGGPDSVFLLDILLKLQEELSLELSLAHINHLLRGVESDADEEFARNTAKKYGLECYVKRADMQKYARDHKIGDEEAGRLIRYSFFEEVLKEAKGDKVALGHNLDDEIETFMFRLMRGTSLKGLEGIPVKRDKYVRPILELYKSQIIDYLHKNDIKYRIDLSNLENNYTRNSIRLDLIPEIEERYNSNFKEKIANLMEEIGQVNNLLKIDYKEFMIEDYLDLEKLQKIADYEKRKVLNSYLLKYDVEVSRKKLDLVLSLMNTGGSKELSLGKKVMFKKEYNKLYVDIDSEKRDQVVLTMNLKIPGEINFGRYRLKAEHCKDCKKDLGENSFIVNLPKSSILEVRTRKPGDKITISKDGLNKKLKDIFINSKVPKEARDKVPIVTLEEEIIWIAGVRGNEKQRAVKPDGNSIKLTVEEGDFSERGQKR